MYTLLDLPRWPRRAAFDYFRAFDAPWFGLCTRVDVSRLKPALTAAGVGSLSLACHYLALRLANEIEPFRYRLAGSFQAPEVHVHDVVHAGATVLRADDSFAFAEFDHDIDFPRFAVRAGAAMAAAREATDFEPRPEHDAIVHITTVPWVHFSSFVHARHPRAAPSVPKIAFGRIDAEASPTSSTPRLWMPLAVDVHHALMDGLHVGRYVQGFEALLQAPETWLPTAGAGT
jgi:chloramphenicol O-acetyltransferase type A